MRFHILYNCADGVTEETEIAASDIEECERLLIERDAVYWEIGVADKDARRMMDELRLGR